MKKSGHKTDPARPFSFRTHPITIISNGMGKVITFSATADKVKKDDASTSRLSR
jgi:hypothetical protein